MRVTIFIVNHILIFKIMFLVLLGIGMYLLVYGINKTHIIKDTYIKAKDKLETDFVKRKHNRYVRDYINLPISKWLDDTFKYSRLYDKQKFIKTSFQYFVVTIGVSAMVLFLAVLNFHRLLFVFGSPVMVFVASYMFLFILRTINRRQVHNDLVSFLNLLGNYSTGNTEITSVFMMIAPKMHEPLRTCLVECVAEAQNINNNEIQALENLQNKIESKKFQEIIKGLSIAQKYSGSFVDVVVNNRVSISSFMKGQKEQKTMAQQNTLTMGVCVGAIFLMMNVLKMIVGKDIIAELFTTTFGNVVLAIMGICILYFLKKMIEVSV